MLFAVSAPAPAANDDLVRDENPAPGGWDPYEVWRTRVKERPGRDPGRGGRRPR